MNCTHVEGGSGCPLRQPQPLSDEPGRLADPDLKRLNGEFDEFIDLSAQS